MLNIRDMEVFELTLGEELSTQISTRTSPVEAQRFYVVISGFQTTATGTVTYGW